MTYYEITNKVSYLVTDNAANMKAAFKVTFPDMGIPAESEASLDTEDDETDLWHINQDQSVDNIEVERISCFAHSLQLTVADGLKETKSVSGAMSKSVAISSLLHRSTTFKVNLNVV